MRRANASSTRGGSYRIFPLRHKARLRACSLAVPCVYSWIAQTEILNHQATELRDNEDKISELQRQVEEYTLQAENKDQRIAELEVLCELKTQSSFV